MNDTHTQPFPLTPTEWIDSPGGVIETLLEQAKQGIVIDASRAGPVPAQVAQLLLSARLQATAAGAEFRLENPTQAVRDSLSTLGLSALFEEAK